MTHLVWNSTFRKSYKKRVSKNPVLKKKFWAALQLFVENPFTPSLRTHKLTGSLNENYAFSIDYSYRVVFQFTAENEVLLIDIGTHDEIY